MIVTTVTIYVMEEHIDEFIEATLDNHMNSRKEPGNIRFDVLQSTNDPSRFTLYEVFKSKEDIEAHRTTAHYLRWRARVDGWMAKQREGVPHQIIAPKEIDAW
jgi:(4S)-4-hydroxy-5-phosphonooxypentane-2,3-dione isomerase